MTVQLTNQVNNQRHKYHPLTAQYHNFMTLKMTTAQVVETSVTVTNSSFQNYTHPDDHTRQTINQTVSHLFIWYRFAATFWSHFIEWYHASTENPQPLQERNYVWCIEQLVILFNPQPFDSFWKILSLL